jgi:hypothetical protein
MTKQQNNRQVTPPWTQWSQHVLTELERLNDIQECLRKEVQNLQMNIVKLQVRAGLWGSVAGMIPGIIGIAIWLLQK